MQKMTLTIKDDSRFGFILELLSGLDYVEVEQETDWWDEISDEERAEIEEGLAQADRGELIPYEQVMAKYKKWL